MASCRKKLKNTTLQNREKAYTILTISSPPHSIRAAIAADKFVSRSSS